MCCLRDAGGWGEALYSTAAAASQNPCLLWLHYPRCPLSGAQHTRPPPPPVSSPRRLRENLRKINVSALECEILEKKRGVKTQSQTLWPPRLQKEGQAPCSRDRPSRSNQGPQAKGSQGDGEAGKCTLSSHTHSQPLGEREMPKEKPHPNSLEKAGRGTRWHFNTCCLLKGSLSRASPTSCGLGPLRTDPPILAVGSSRQAVSRQAGCPQGPGLSPPGGKSSHLGSQSGPSLGLRTRPLAPTLWRLQLPAEVEVATPREPRSSDQNAREVPVLRAPWHRQVLPRRPWLCSVTFPPFP